MPDRTSLRLVAEMLTQIVEPAKLCVSTVRKSHSRLDKLWLLICFAFKRQGGFANRG